MENEIKDIVGQIIKFLTDRVADVKVVVAKDDEVKVDINIDGAGQLIGRGGQTIAAIRLVASLLIRQKLKFTGRLHLDINDYYKNKDEELLEKVRQTVDEVINQQASRQIFYLTPRERRLVHIYCDKIKEVQTQSVDSNKGRVLVIEPVFKDVV